MFSDSNNEAQNNIVGGVGLGVCFREGGVDVAHGARQEALSSASVLAGAVARGW